MTPRVSGLMAAMERIAPAALAQEGDNVGLLAGDPSDSLTGVYVALDLTVEAVQDARAHGCSAVLTHHPILYRPVRALRLDDPALAPALQLIRSGMSLFTAHTNWDMAQGGVRDCLADALELSGRAVDGLVAAGDLPRPVPLSQLAAWAGRRLGCDLPRYYGPDREVRRLAVCGGAGMSEARVACALGVDAYLTGDVTYHDAQDAAAEGLALVDCGHAETERLSLSFLGRRLQTEFSALQWHIPIFISDLPPLAGRLMMSARAEKEATDDAI